MGNQFYKGRTNNHLTWVMVDATDFATPESALSAATKIKIYGKVRGGTGVNFVSSGAGSLTNDITHVGASALGIYTIALVKADLSDASAAWYDQYIISLSATGAAYQTLVVDGGIDASALSAYQSRLSDLASALLVTQSMASDAASAAQQAASRVLLTQSSISDIQSYLAGMSGVLSDVYSAAAASPDTSDIASAVWAEAAGAAVSSRVLVILSNASDIQSKISDLESNLLSVLGTTGITLDASTLSDLRSAIAAGPAATITASDISDIASAVRATLVSDLSDILSAAQQANSRVLLNQSRVSDIYSLLSDVSSDLGVMSGVLSDTYSLLSDLHSDVTVMSGVVSDVYSNLTRGVNVTQLNGTSLNGDGAGTPWGP